MWPIIIVLVVIAVIIGRAVWNQKPPAIVRPPLVLGAAGTPLTPPPPAPKKGYGWIGIIVIVAMIAVLAGFVIPWMHCKTSDTIASGPANKQPAEVWVFEWELPPGQYVRGLNRSGPIMAVIVMRDDKNLWINTPYIEYGKAEVTRIFLTKIGEKSWEGPWEQNYPKDFGRCDLHEVSPDNFAGNMTGTAGLSAFCTLKRKY